MIVQGSSTKPMSAPFLRHPASRMVTAKSCVAGKEGLVRVATVKTSTGTYKRPVTKIALLLPSEN